ncbi:MAG TPA: peptidylprolyl isomerase [Micromonosporaceae bacterium]|nr:peptidylprolyl isomerase [Micromonosporaceae bacterium]
MGTSKNRQRAMARAKVERQIARRAAALRRRRQIQAAIGATLAVLVVALGVAWTAGAFESTPATPADCTWNTRAASAEIKDVGVPSTANVPKSGVKPMTITTGLGVIEAQLDLVKAPCTAANFTYLASKKFFENTKCHRLSTNGLFVLQCGDPSATGKGGPTYTFADENLPQAPAVPSADPSASPAAPAPNLYPRGTLAMANSGEDTNSSQFFIVYKDGSQLEPKYSVFGTITKGMDIVDKVAEAGVQDTGGQASTDGTPKTEVLIQSLTVGDAQPAVPTTPAAPGSGTPAPSGSAGGTGSAAQQP